MTENSDSGSAARTEDSWIPIALFTGPTGALLYPFNQAVGLGLVALPLVLEGLSIGVEKIAH